jgi:hypothetical protein
MSSLATPWLAVPRDVAVGQIRLAGLRSALFLIAAGTGHVREPNYSNGYILQPSIHYLPLTM